MSDMKPYSKTNLFLKFVTVVCVIFSAVSVFANEEAKPAAGHEEKKPEGSGHGEKKEEGGGHGEKKEEGGGHAEKKSTPEWVEVMAKLQGLKAKVNAKQDGVNKLIADKNYENDPVKMKEIIKNLVSEHKELLKLTEEYEQQRSYFLYRFPEKSMSQERHYERIEIKPLEEIETQLTLEGKVSRTLNKVRKQYGSDQESIKRQEDLKKKKKQETEKSSITEPVVISK